MADDKHELELKLNRIYDACCAHLHSPVLAAFYGQNPRLVLLQDKLRLLQALDQALADGDAGFMDALGRHRDLRGAVADLFRYRFPHLLRNSTPGTAAAISAAYRDDYLQYACDKARLGVDWDQLVDWEIVGHHSDDGGKGKGTLTAEQTTVKPAETVAATQVEQAPLASVDRVAHPDAAGRETPGTKKKKKTSPLKTMVTVDGGDDDAAADQAPGQQNKKAAETTTTQPGGENAVNGNAAGGHQSPRQRQKKPVKTTSTSPLKANVPVNDDSAASPQAPSHAKKQAVGTTKSPLKAKVAVDSDAAATAGHQALRQLQEKKPTKPMTPALPPKPDAFANHDATAGQKPSSGKKRQPGAEMTMSPPKADAVAGHDAGTRQKTSRMKSKTTGAEATTSTPRVEAPVEDSAAVGPKSPGKQSKITETEATTSPAGAHVVVDYALISRKSMKRKRRMRTEITTESPPKGDTTAAGHQPPSQKRRRKLAEPATQPKKALAPPPPPPNLGTRHQDPSKRAAPLPLPSLPPLGPNGLPGQGSGPEAAAPPARAEPVLGRNSHSLGIHAARTAAGVKKTRRPEKADALELRTGHDALAAPAAPELAVIPRQGCPPDPHAIQLARARNFLADCDVDRTPHWESRVAELSRYLHDLLQNWNGESWGPDLRRAIGMLHVHSVFERHFYGSPPPVMDFAPPPRFRRRLALAAGRIHRPRPTRAALGSADDDDDGQTIQPAIHRPPGFVHDAPTGRFLSSYRADVQALWAHGAEDGAMDEEENLGLIEDEAFRRQLVASPGSLDAAAADGRHHGESTDLSSMARRRGRRRAALQLALRSLPEPEREGPPGSRSLLLLPPQPPREPREFPFAFFDVPRMAEAERTHDDPFIWTGLFHQMRALETREAAAQRDLLHARLGREMAPGPGAPDRRPEIPTNFLGPLPTEARIETEADDEAALVRLRRLAARLEIAQSMAPRPLLGAAIDAVARGLRGDAPDPDHGPRMIAAGFGVGGGRADLDLVPVEEQWLRFLLETPTSLRRVANPILTCPGANRELPAAADRVEALMEDLSPLNPFRIHSNRVTVQDFAHMVNRGCSGPVLGRRRYTVGEVMELCHRLHDHGRVRYETAPGGHPAQWWVSRPPYGLYPEDRIAWTEREVRPRPGGARVPRQADMRTFDDVAAAAAAADAGAGVHSSSSRDRVTTACFFIHLAYRLGRQIAMLEPRVDAALHVVRYEAEFDQLELPIGAAVRAMQIRSEQASHRWTAAVRASLADQAAESGPRGRPRTLAAVASLADPDILRESRDLDPRKYGSLLYTLGDRGPPAAGTRLYGRGRGGPEEGQESTESATAVAARAAELVRIALVREATVNGNPVGRENPARGGGGGGDGIWGWARPNVAPTWDQQRARRAPYFSLDRWPVHLQPAARQAAIRASGAGPARRAAEERVLAERRHRDYLARLTSTNSHVVTWGDPEVLMPPPTEGRGWPVFGAGDTPMQEQYLIDYATKQVEDAFLVKKKSWLSFLPPFGRAPAHGREVVSLPVPSARDTPKSRRRGDTEMGGG